MKHTSVLYFFIFWKSRKCFGQWLSCFTCACLFNTFAVWFCISLCLSNHLCLDDNPPGNKTSWLCRNNVSLYVPATSQVRLKWNTQLRLDGTSLRGLSGTPPWHLIGTSWRLSRGCNNNVSSVCLHDVSSKSSNETPKDVSLVRHQDISVVRIHDVSCKSQMKTQKRRCGTSPPRLRVTLSGRLVIRSLIRFQVILSWPPSDRFPRFI